MGEGSSNALPSALARTQDMEYLIASNTNVSNFISVKLSGNHNYLLWKAQMLCLLDSNGMCGILNETSVAPRDNSTSRYDSLVKGWIFGSVSEDVLVDVFNLSSAKAVWEKLKSIYEPPVCDTEQGGRMENVQGRDAINVIVGEDIVPAEIETIKENTQKKMQEKQKSYGNWRYNRYITSSSQYKKLREYTIKGDWPKAESILKGNKDLVVKAIRSDGSTMLHLAVGIGQNDFVKRLLSYNNSDELELKQRDSDGSTALHIAATVGNKHAAELLVRKNSKLLQIADNNGQKPFDKAYENMHLHTIVYLLKALNSDGPRKTGDQLHSSNLTSTLHPADRIGVELLLNAISAKEYSLASELIEAFPMLASKNDDVLMAIAKSSPRGLEFWETLLYPSLDGISELIVDGTSALVHSYTIPRELYEFAISWMDTEILRLLTAAILTVPSILLVVFVFMTILFLIVCYVFVAVYFIPCNVARMLDKNVDKKKKEWDEATEVLRLVCDEIDMLDYSGTHHPFYNRPILEAATRNAYNVVDEILFRSPEAIQSTDKSSGFDIIQLAIINRSEKIYNLIYDVGERKNLYRTYLDLSRNNILHLAGKLAPSSVLNQKTGAALQLQRELQWREEVKKLVFPTYTSQENIFKETPDMVFTREHKELVKEGEQWMKTTAESCSITAALITTIVFAAAITVPGGNNQEKGTPLFRNEAAFIVFAVSDAISLFASSTALLVFLSILTARFAEKDFLVSLPRRLFIGLCSLFISTTAMMVAYSATLFLVFFDKKLWMLAPICGLAFIPIGFFVALQFPLMVDLFRSTYLPIFGKQRGNFLTRFNPNDIRLFFR